MQQLVSGVVRFQQEVFPSCRDEFQQLRGGQSPHTLLITCSDSRIDPGLLTQTRPGEVFVCRNAGNLVPPFGPQGGESLAAIEFAVTVLGISDIVVCGHSDCGAMKAAMAPESLDQLPILGDWLHHSRAATAAVAQRRGGLRPDLLDEVTRENALQQLQHLRTHPAVAARLATGAIGLHAWVYDIGRGQVLCHDSGTGDFRPVEERYGSMLVG